MIAALALAVAIGLWDRAGCRAEDGSQSGFRALLDELGKKKARQKDEEVVRLTLLAHIETELKKKETPLTPGGKDYLKSVLAKATAQLIDDSGNAKKVAATEKSTEKLIVTLAELGKEEKRVDIPTIDRAMSRLCPLYPFCRSDPWTKQPSWASRSRKTSTLC
jgi:hypothetical protein